MTSHRHGALQRQPFTLLELLISMGMLVIMMLMMLQVLVFMQAQIRDTSATNDIYTNARVALDVVERDIRSAICSTIPDKEIAFYVGAPDPESAASFLYTTFVVSCEPNEGATCRLNEVSYGYHRDTMAASPATPAFTLCRQQTSDNDDSNWDFTGHPNGWEVNNVVDPELADFEPIIGGVSRFNVTFYDQDGREIAPDTHVTTLPQRVEVYIEVFDSRLQIASRAERMRTARGFSKIVYLGDLRTD